MRKLWPWILGLTVVVLIGLVVLFGFGLLRTQWMPMFGMGHGDRLWRDNFLPEYGMRGVPVMGVLGLLLILFLSVGFIGLLVLGVVLLVRALQKPDQTVDRHPAAQCANCGKKVAPNWAVCPYCGEPLGDED